MKYLTVSMRFFKVCISVLVLFTVAACGGGGGGSSPTPSPSPSPTPTPSPTPAPSTGASFTDATAVAGINYKQGYIGVTELSENADPVPPMVAPTFIQRFAGGVASGDYDDDGLIDLFIVRGDIGPNLLYHNLGNNVFEEVAVEAGLAYTKTASTNHRHSGPTFADIDGDRDLDLFIGSIEGDPSLLYRNDGDGTFTNVTPGSGIDTIQSPYNISSAWGDYDLDGDIDLFITHWGVPKALLAETEHLWRNDGDFKFTNVSLSSGITEVFLNTEPTKEIPQDYSFAPIFARINDDAYPDILVTADFSTTLYFINNQDGTFTDATDRNVIIDENGMGNTVGDYDNDGDLDWFVSSIWEEHVISGTEVGNRLYRNDGGVFVDVTKATGVENGGWGWGSCFADFDNDADLDIYHTNGFIEPGLDFWAEDISVLFLQGDNEVFVESAASAGLDDNEMGRGIVCADFDNDGDIDLFQGHNDPVNSGTYYRNDSQQRNYLKVELRGEAPNTQAAGARIYVTTGTKTQMREIIIGNNFTSQNPAIQTFGLGNIAQADELKISWPDGQETLMNNVSVNQTLTLDHPDL